MAWSASAPPKGKAFAITKMVEKPKASEAPSNLSITGRYILQPQIFELLEKQAAGAGGEIQLTDAMVALARTQPFYGLKFEGRSFDCGSKIGFLVRQRRLWAGARRYRAGAARRNAPPARREIALALQTQCQA